MKIFKDLKTEIRNAIWASSEPENLITQHDDHFQEAAAEIAKWVPGERDDNVNVIRFFKTNYKAGMTVFQPPRGIVTRIFTVANDEYSDPVFYRQVAWPAPEAWARNLFLFPLPPLTQLPKLPRGFQFADPANDSLYGRARTGIWSFYQGRVFMAPWIQSNESVVVEWKGIKELWNDADLVNPDILYKRTMKLYVQYAHERDYGDEGRALQFHNPASYRGHYDEALGDLIHEGEERLKVRALPDGGHERNRLCAELADDAPPSPIDGVIIADLGNISLPGHDLDDVALLARSWNPDHVTACGMIAGALTNYDLTAGAKFYDFMAPYLGIQGVGGQTAAFWAVPGAADWAKDSIASWAAFFTAPATGHYDVLLGDVHLFVIDSSSLNPDGNDSASVQAQWLQARLATSTAAWKVVKMEGAAYGSVRSNGTLQWPFKAWGADMLITSQTRIYERLNVDDLVVINNGLGGQTPIEEAGGSIADTMALYAAGFGAGKITATLDAIQYEFFDVDGDLVDSVLITKEAGVIPPAPGGGLPAIGVPGGGVLVDPGGGVVVFP